MAKRLPSSAIMETQIRILGLLPIRHVAWDNMYNHILSQVCFVPQACFHTYKMGEILSLPVTVIVKILSFIHQDFLSSYVICTGYIVIKHINKILPPYGTSTIM